MSVETLWSGPGTFSERDEVTVVKDRDAWRAFVRSLDDRPSPGPVQLALASTPIDFARDAVVVVFATTTLKAGETLVADDALRNRQELVIKAHVQASQQPAGARGLETHWLVLRLSRALVDGATSARAEFGSQAVAMISGSEPTLA